MRIQIEKSGDSRIIVLPDEVLKGCKPGDELEVDILRSALVLKPADHKYRDLWAASLKDMKPGKMDYLLIEEPHNIEMDDWEW